MILPKLGATQNMISEIGWFRCLLQLQVSVKKIHFFFGGVYITTFFLWNVTRFWTPMSRWLMCPANALAITLGLTGPINWLIYLINQLKIVMKQLHNDCHFIFSRGFGSYLCVWPWSSKVINACFCRMFILTLNIYWKKLISSVLFGRF